MANTELLFPILNSQAFDSPIFEPRPFSPLARAAAEAPLDSSGHLTEYRPLESKSILTKVVARRQLPFTHSINPYRGCEFGCRYCYARYTHEFLELRSPEEFERKIYFKQNAAWLLTQELARLKPGTQIALGTATDPYQPLERRQRITRSLLEVFAKHEGFSLGIVTKSSLIARDLDLLVRIAERNKLTIHITVTTTNARLARILEPRAPSPELRLKALAEVRQAGLRAGVMCSPLMPGITDSRPSISAVAKAASAAGAQFFVAGALFLKPCSQGTFLKFVGEHFPGQLEGYKRRYSENAFVSAEYRKRVRDLVESVCKEYKLGRRYSYNDDGDGSAVQQPAFVESQPWLPFG
jgi:DNA repair photolyase